MKVHTLNQGECERILVTNEPSKPDGEYYLFKGPSGWEVYRVESEEGSDWHEFKLKLVASWYEHFDAVTGAICDLQDRSTQEAEKAAIEAVLENSNKFAELSPDDIPEDWPVLPISEEDKNQMFLNGTDEHLMTCGTCGLTWTDSVTTSMTPAPSGRCPFEYWHKDRDV